jgi:hypothetical protein
MRLAQNIRGESTVVDDEVPNKVVERSILGLPGEAQSLNGATESGAFVDL